MAKNNKLGLTPKSDNPDASSNEERLDFILNSIEVGLWELIFNKNGEDQLSWSEGMFRLFNVDPETFQHSYDDFEQCVHPDDKQKIKQHIEDCIRTKEVMNIQFRLISHLDQIHYIAAQAKATYDDAGNPLRLTGINHDITPLEDEKIKVQQLYIKMSNNEKKYRALFESSSDAIMLLEDSKFIECNDATLLMFGCKDRSSFLGCHPSIFSPPKQPDDRPSLVAADAYIAQSAREGNAKFPWMHCRLDGTEFPAEVLLTPVNLEGRNIIQATVRDITALTRKQDKLITLSTHDKLTGLHNRSALEKPLSKAIKQSNHSSMPLAVLMLDIDFFKNINDTFGHPAGDFVLKHLASTITATIREKDIGIRLGGDEFIILLTEVTCDEARRFAERVLRIIELSPVDIYQKQPIHYSVSIGIATYPADGLNKTDLLTSADKALYLAKNSGRNKVSTHTPTK